jgi:hypothetical protein
MAGVVNFPSLQLRTPFLSRSASGKATELSAPFTIFVQLS